MKNKGVMISLAVIFVLGVLITKSTHRFVERNLSEATSAGSPLAQEQAYETERSAALDAEAQEEGAAEALDAGSSQVTTESRAEETVPESISPLDTAPAALMEDSYGDSIEKAASAEELMSPYKKRLLDLDAQIQKSRDSQTSSNVNSSARSAASGELKLWDSELNTIYNEILERLDREGSEKLVEAQRAWMKERDNLAMEAARNSAGGSRESVEYTVSLTESTRQRAYELVELYADVLEQ